ncbi:MAG: DUF2630 family protein [Acidimicrobiales bacterium]
MEDTELIAGIDALVAEEHELEAKAGGGEALTADELARLAQLEVRLDQCWDLLRQRRALRHAGKDPDEATTRPADVVEKYAQ